MVSHQPLDRLRILFTIDYKSAENTFLFRTTIETSVIDRQLFGRSVEDFLEVLPLIFLPSGVIDPEDAGNTIMCASYELYF